MADPEPKVSKQAALAEMARRIDAGEMEYDFDTSDVFQPYDASILSDIGSFVHRPPKRREGESDTAYRLRDDMAWKAIKRRAAEAGKTARRIGRAGKTEDAQAESEPQESSIIPEVPEFLQSMPIVGQAAQMGTQAARGIESFGRTAADEGVGAALQDVGEGAVDAVSDAASGVGRFVSTTMEHGPGAAIDEAAGDELLESSVDAANQSRAIMRGVDQANLGAISAAGEAAGVDDLREKWKQAAEEEPAISTGAGVLASMSPQSIVGKLGRGGAGVSKALAQKTGAGRALSAGIGGATAAAEAGLASEAEKALDSAVGRESEANTLRNMLLAGGLGAVTEGAGGAARVLRKKLPELEALEEAGGTTSFRKKVEPSPRVGQLLQDARARRMEPADVISARDRVANQQRALRREQLLEELRGVRRRRRAASGGGAGRAGGGKRDPREVLDEMVEREQVYQKIRRARPEKGQLNEEALPFELRDDPEFLALVREAEELGVSPQAMHRIRKAQQKAEGGLARRPRRPGGGAEPEEIPSDASPELQAVLEQAKELGIPPGRVLALAEMQHKATQASSKAQAMKDLSTYNALRGQSDSMVKPIPVIGGLGFRAWTALQRLLRASDPDPSRVNRGLGLGLRMDPAARFMARQRRRALPLAEQAPDAIDKLDPEEE